VLDIWTKAISSKISDDNWIVRIIRVGGRFVRKVRHLSEQRFLQNDIIEVEVEFTSVKICTNDDGCSETDVDQSYQEGQTVISNVVESVERGTFVQTIQEEAAVAGLTDVFSTVVIDEVMTEEPQTEVIDPTPFPSTDITSPPSASPNKDTSQYRCDDSPFRFKVRYGGETKFKSCVWVARHPNWKCQLEGVSTQCPSTCKTCRLCSDSTLRFILNDNSDSSISTKSCDWVERQSTEFRCAIPGIAETCRSTCESCCMDSSDTFAFVFNGKQLTKPCEWAARFNTDERCEVPEVSFNCPKTCGLCCIDSTDTFAFTFNGKQVTKPCEWVARFNTEERCKVPEVSDNCPQTCGTC